MGLAWYLNIKKMSSKINCINNFINVNKDQVENNFVKQRLYLVSKYRNEIESYFYLNSGTKTKLRLK